MIEELKEQTGKILDKQKVLKEYENKIVELDKEIEKLEAESKETISFELDSKIADKKSLRSQLGQRFKQAQERTQKDVEVIAGGLTSKAQRYATSRINSDETVEKEYQEVRSAMLTAYDKYKDYEQARKDLAADIDIELEKADYFKTVRYADTMNVFNTGLHMMRSKPKMDLEGGDVRGKFSPRQFFENLERNTK